jgi:hypothetical protein
MSSWHVARHVAVVDGWLRAQGLTGATGANDNDTQRRCFPYCGCHYAALPLTLHDSLGENPVQIPCTCDSGASGTTFFFLEASFQSLCSPIGIWFSCSFSMRLYLSVLHCATWG